jgi:hypothetical protein
MRALNHGRELLELLGELPGMHPRERLRRVGAGDVPRQQGTVGGERLHALRVVLEPEAVERSATATAPDEGEERECQGSPTQIAIGFPLWQRGKRRPVTAYVLWGARVTWLRIGLATLLDALIVGYFVVCWRLFGR